MPKVKIASNNKSKGFEGYPKLKLKKGEKARICLIEPDPTMIYVHTFTKPVVEDGQIVMETRQGKKGDYEVPKTEFISTFQCLGNVDVIEKEGGSGTDGANCPACKAAEEDPDYFDPPKRKFGQHVIKYSTKAGSSQVATPFQANLVAWVYPESRFDKIIDLAEEQEGDVRSFDLILGPCENEGWQKYDISASGRKAEWLKNSETKKLVTEIFKNNQCEDMESQIARKEKGSQIMSYVLQIKDRWAEVGKVGGDADEDDEDTTDLLGDTDLGSLLSGDDSGDDSGDEPEEEAEEEKPTKAKSKGKSKKAKKEPEPEPEDSDGDDESEEEVEATPAPAASEDDGDEDDEDGDIPNFDDLLADLNKR